MNIFEKLARRITRRSWNHTVHHIVVRAMKRKVIDSHQAHAILGMWNRECFPEWQAVEHSLHPTSETLPDLQAVSTPEHSATSQSEF